jgi:hypothetical protein
VPRIAGNSLRLRRSARVQSRTDPRSGWHVSLAVNRQMNTRGTHRGRMCTVFLRARLGRSTPCPLCLCVSKCLRMGNAYRSFGNTEAQRAQRNGWNGRELRRPTRNQSGILRTPPHTLANNRGHTRKGEEPRTPNTAFALFKPPRPRSSNRDRRKRVRFTPSRLPPAPPAWPPPRSPSTRESRTSSPPSRDARASP